MKTGSHPPKGAFDLGLAISGALLKPGERRTDLEISIFINAAGAHCSRQRIQQIAQKALRKLRRKLYCDPMLCEAMKHIFHR